MPPADLAAAVAALEGLGVPAPGSPEGAPPVPQGPFPGRPRSAGVPR
jgi:hypothetical protein